MGMRRRAGKGIALCIAFAAVLLSLQTTVLADKPSVSPGSGQTVGALATAYITCDQNYLTIGQPAHWMVRLSGDVGDFTYRFSLFFKQTQSEDDSFLGIKEQVFSRTNAFDYTVGELGYYYMKAFVRDGTGKTLELASEPYLAVSGGDWNERNTVLGAVKAVAAQCIRETGNTAFDRALWLHDWLIRQAEYDDSLSEYDPDGVLLKGTGTCQSYALAYQLLLGEAGVESIFVAGTADGGPHAWNLVNFDGFWYHVDVTWDDQGGDEPEYAYFGLPDAMMARDHDWSGGNLYPASGSAEYDILEQNGYRVFTDADGLAACLHAALSQKQESFRLYYAGEDSLFDLVDGIKAWWEFNSAAYPVSEIRWGASAWEGSMETDYYDP